MRRTQLWTFVCHTQITWRSLQSRHCKSMNASNCFQVPRQLSSAVACTCSREVGCMAAGLWVIEEAGWVPEEVESSFRAEPGLSVLSSTCASRGRKYFWLMFASLHLKRKENQTTEVYIRQDHTHYTHCQTIASHLICPEQCTGALAVITSL